MKTARERVNELFYGKDSIDSDTPVDVIVKIEGEWQADKDEIVRLQDAIRAVRHKGYCAIVKYACRGIEIERGVFSGCLGLQDCPVCEGKKKECTCGIDKWKDCVLNNNYKDRNAEKETQ